MLAAERLDVPHCASDARGLIRSIASAYDVHYGLSTTSCQVFDTAWVAMIAKSVHGQKKWLFEGSFRYLLRTQSSDGSWGRHTASQTATILDTAAALFGLIKHVQEPLQIVDISPMELQGRIAKATSSLNTQLAHWHDLSTTNHVGVELLVPALLQYLEQEGVSLTMDYPAQGMLQRMHAEKMSRFNLEKLYESEPSSALHSLEAFIGRLDFNRISHHLFQGSMLASPSSTAAYLMHASEWDDRAESYLRHVYDRGSGHGDGGIPGTFPTTYFEYSWTLCTLLQNGFDRGDLESIELQKMVSTLREGFVADGGIIGFAPRAVDVDDTAKGLLALSLLGQLEDLGAEVMIEAFETHDHFRTFASERDPSISSNCHVILALCHLPDCMQYRTHITKATQFVCNAWWASDEFISDKWHLCHLYPTMLVVEAFTNLLRMTDIGTFANVFPMDLLWKICTCLFQACHRTLLEQKADGSWNGSLEQTAYAILTLTNGRRVVFFKDLDAPLGNAINRGVEFLESTGFNQLDHHWTSKTAYGVEFVAHAYYLAALRTQRLSKDKFFSLGTTMSPYLTNPKHENYLELLSKTPLLYGTPKWQVRASLIESSLFVPLLRAQTREVFVRNEDKIEKDDYLDIIPFTWVSCNNGKRIFSSTWLLYEMMVISMLGYQVDEFVESIVDPVFADDPARFHKLISDVITKSTGTHGEPELVSEGQWSNLAGYGDMGTTVTDIEKTLLEFCSRILRHPMVEASSAWDQLNLRREMESFLHAHATQSVDNGRFRKQAGRLKSAVEFSQPGRTFSQWVQSTAADHVACAYSFAFMCCLISSSLGAGAEMFSTVNEKYLANAVVRHMSTVCRMSNDVGSIARDIAEMNLNSIHFPEFSGQLSTGEDPLPARKRALMSLARYEHECLEQSLVCLRHEVEQGLRTQGAGQVAKRKLDIVGFFCDVTDTYDQLYLVQDLSSRMK